MEHIERIQNLLALEVLDDDVTFGLSGLGHHMERRIPKHRGPVYKFASPAVDAFCEKTRCKDRKTARFYLDQSGWDPSVAIHKYFKAGGAPVPLDAPPMAPMRPVAHTRSDRLLPYGHRSNGHC